jgi:hypothetical protein
MKPAHLSAAVDVVLEDQLVVEGTFLNDDGHTLTAAKRLPPSN